MRGIVCHPSDFPENAVAYAIQMSLRFVWIGGCFARDGKLRVWPDGLNRRRDWCHVRPSGSILPGVSICFWPHDASEQAHFVVVGHDTYHEILAVKFVATTIPKSEVTGARLRSLFGDT